MSSDSARPVKRRFNVSLISAVHLDNSLALVRTLADVFTDQTWLVQHYAAYVLHLEQALQDVKDALDVVQPLLIGKAKKLNDKDVLREQKRLARAIMVR